MGLAAGRSRRSRRENTGRSAALDKIRSGQKNKYEVTDDDKVYDMVDENEYSRRVQERLEDDWIVDDGEWGWCCVCSVLAVIMEGCGE